MTPVISSLPVGLSAMLSQHPSMLLELPSGIGLDVPRSGKWEGVRKKYVKAHPTCEACGVTDIDVHHVKPYHLIPELELDVANLIGLCRVHHFVFGHLMNWKAYNPAVRRMVASYRKSLDKRPFALAA